MKTQHKQSVLHAISLLLPYVALVLVIAVFGVTSQGKLFSAFNIRVVVQQTIALSTICLGAVFVYSLGEMDVSIGACVGVCCLTAISLLNRGVPLVGAFLVTLSVALLFGLINGAVSALLKLPAILTSLFLMFVGGGIQNLITLKSNTITTEYDLSRFMDMRVQLLVLVVLAVLCGYVFKLTRIGLYTRAVGANAICAQQSGVGPMKYRLLAFLIMGVNIAIASVFVLSRSASASRATGSGMAMDVMIALILGGMPLAGGMKSRYSSALVGPLIYVLLTNGLTLSGVSITYVPMVKAVIFLVIVILTCRKQGGVLPR